MRNYFRGWYYRCQSDHQTLAIIPSIHKAGSSKFCAIQLITDDSSYYARFSFSDLHTGSGQVRIGKNRFGKEGLSLDIHTPELDATGKLHFGGFTPLQYDIMGPFQYVPFMQCRHSVYSMQHSVNGTFSVNGTPYVFRDAAGYLEGDRGYSFPKEYAWTQCSFPGGALMLSVADIPLGSFHFTGIIGVVLLRGKEYRLATYLGASAVKIQDGEIHIRQGHAHLTVKLLEESGYPLCAPISGAMTRTIHEHPSCRVYYRFEDHGTTLLELDTPNAAFEYEY